MSSLAQLQQAMADYLLAPRRDDADPCVAQVAPSPSRSAAEQLGLYRILVRSQHGDALRETYPACCALVGLPYFRQLAAQFFAAFPTTDPNLDHYGAEWADFLEGVVDERPEAARLTVLPDLARLEWAWYQASWATDPVVLAMDEPVHLLWDALLEDREPPHFLGGGSVLAEIWRDGEERRIRVMPAV